VVEAMELRTRGLSYNRLGMIFNVDSKCILNNIRGAEQHGYNWWRV